MNSLIVYFSRTGMNYFEGTIKNIEKGNTEVVAEKIQEKTGANLFELTPVKPYSSNYQECVKEAIEEARENARPEIRNTLSSIEEYDIIYLGYPNWCGTLPKIILTFLENYDFSGKVIRPFCTNEGSGLGRSEIDIKKTCPKAKVQIGLSIIGHEVEESEEKITNWINTLNNEQ